MYQSSVRQAMIVVAIALAVLTASPAAQTQPPAKIDVTGEWVFEVQTQAGTATPHATLKQDGEKLTGHYSSAMLGEADLAGTVKGRAIEFSFTVTVQGNSISVAYSGTVEDNNTMKGTIAIAGLGDGTFTGKRK